MTQGNLEHSFIRSLIHLSFGFGQEVTKAFAVGRNTRAVRGCCN